MVAALGIPISMLLTVSWFQQFDRRQALFVKALCLVHEDCQATIGQTNGLERGDHYKR
jgi:hypothetical protein